MWRGELATSAHRALLLAAVAMLSGGVARGEMVTFEFQAEVIESWRFGVPVPGTRVSGTLAYDPATGIGSIQADGIQPRSPLEAAWYPAGVLSDVPALRFRAADYTNPEEYPWFGDDFVTAGVELTFFLPPGTDLSGVLPRDLRTLGATPITLLVENWEDGYRGEVREIQLLVPEPGALALAAVGCLGILAGAARRRFPVGPSSLLPFSSR